MKKLIKILLIVLFCNTCFAVTTVTRYVDPDATGAGDGTSWTDAYTSLSAWNSAEAEDITSGGSDEEHICNCRSSGGSEDSSVVNMNGWTTDATHTITIQVATTDRHDGTRSTGYYLEVSANGQHAVLCQEEYVTFDGLAFYNKHVNGRKGIYCNQDNITIKNCLAYDNGWEGIHAAGTSGVLIENCIAYGNGYDGIVSKTANVYHCTSTANGEYGFMVSEFGTTEAKNCYAGGNTGGDYGEADGTATLNTTTCHDSDGSADTTTAYSTSSGCYFTNVTAGTEDLTITSSSSGLDGTGTAGVSTYDFEGETRDVSNPDVGADEYIEAAATGQVIMIMSY